MTPESHPYPGPALSALGACFIIVFVAVVVSAHLVWWEGYVRPAVWITPLLAVVGALSLVSTYLLGKAPIPLRYGTTAVLGLLSGSLLWWFGMPHLYPEAVEALGPGAGLSWMLGPTVGLVLSVWLQNRTTWRPGALALLVTCLLAGIVHVRLPPPESRYWFIVYFNRHTPREEVQRFEERFYKPGQATELGLVHLLRDAIAGVDSIGPDRGHPRIAVSLWRSTDEFLRDSVRASLRSSPIVYDVRECSTMTPAKLPPTLP